MPQLNPDSFLTQAIWLVITFSLLYLVIWRAALPRISSVLRDRRERVDEDLEKAEALKAQAEETLAAYETAVAEGHQRVQEILRQATERLAREADARHASLGERLAHETGEAEKRIAAAKRDAMDGMRAVAAEIAQAASSRLAGYEVPQADADRAVAAVMERPH